MSLLHADLCRALLNRHRLPALLHITRALRPEAFPPEQWRLLTGRGGGGGVATAAGATGGPAPAPTWVPEERGAAYAALLAAVPGLEADAELRDASMWGPWVAASPSSGGAAGAAGGGDDVPARVAARLGALTKLLLLKALKPEALHAALSRSAWAAHLSSGWLRHRTRWESVRHDREGTAPASPARLPFKRADAPPCLPQVCLRRAAAAQHLAAGPQPRTDHQRLGRLYPAARLGRIKPGRGRRRRRRRPHAFVRSDAADNDAGRRPQHRAVRGCGRDRRPRAAARGCDGAGAGRGGAAAAAGVRPVG